LSTKASIRQKFQGKEVEEVLEHPLIDLLEHVNPATEAFNLRYLTEQSQEATGNAFWWKCRGALGTPEELYFLYPQLVKVVADKQRSIAGFKYGRGNNAIFIPIEDIVYFRRPDISNPVLGVGDIEKAVTAVDLSNQMNVHSLTMISKGGMPETVMTFPAEQTVSPAEITRLKRDYKKFQGTRNAGKFMIANGGAKIEKVSFSQKEMEYLGGRKWTRDEIYTIFGVPSTFTNAAEVSKANLDGANVEYQRRTIKPKLIQTEDVINEQLVSEFDESLFVAFDENVPMDMEFRLKERSENIRVGYSTVNEERGRDGLDPIEGGDELATQNPPAVEPVKRIKARQPSIDMPKANFIPVAFVDAVQDYLKAFGNAVLTLADDEAFKHVKVADPGDLVSRWFDFSVWDKRAENTILPFVQASILVGGPQAMKLVDSDREFDASSPGVQSLLTQRSIVIRGMNRTIQKDTRAAVAAGIELGETGSQVRKRIEGVFGFADKNRATRIARTETIWALNAGAVEGYKQSGVVAAKEWSTAADERVCQWCGPMDGKIVGLEGDYFKMGDQFVGRDGGTLNFPIENVGHPPLHPQCRCAIVPVVREV
jgi:HK97 family phage portal protein